MYLYDDDINNDVDRKIMDSAMNPYEETLCDMIVLLETLAELGDEQSIADLEAINLQRQQGVDAQAIVEGELGF